MRYGETPIKTLYSRVSNKRNASNKRNDKQKFRHPLRLFDTLLNKSAKRVSNKAVTAGIFFSKRIAVTLRLLDTPE